MTAPDLLTLEEIAELTAVLKGITPLPWKADNYNIYGASKRAMVADNDDPEAVARMRGFGSGQPQERNLHAIAAIMNAAAALLRAARIVAEQRIAAKEQK